MAIQVLLHRSMMWLLHFMHYIPYCNRMQSRNTLTQHSACQVTAVCVQYTVWLWLTLLGCQHWLFVKMSDMQLCMHCGTV